MQNSHNFGIIYKYLFILSIQIIVYVLHDLIQLSMDNSKNSDSSQNVKTQC